MNRVRQLTLLCLVCAILWKCGNTSRAADRFALVIGNAKYSGGQELRNPANDAVQVSAALRKLGFSVEVVNDGTKPQMEAAIRRFADQLGKDKLGLFFFAGHGMQVKGVNYLIPIGAQIKREFDVRFQCLDVGYVLEAMESVDNSLNVLVLDCCRDNRFKRAWTRNGEVGLAPIATVPDGTIIAFSTAPGRTAEDGRGDTSPYVKHFVRSLELRPEAGTLELQQVFRATAQELRQETGQRSWANMDLSVVGYNLWEGQRTAVAKIPKSNALVRPAATVEPKPSTNVRHELPKMANRPKGHSSLSAPPFVDPLEQSSTPAPPPTRIVINGSGVTDAKLYVRQKDMAAVVIAPSKSLQLNEDFEYFTGSEWITYKLGHDERIITFLDSKQAGKATWVPATELNPQFRWTSQGNRTTVYGTGVRYGLGDEQHRVSASVSDIGSLGATLHEFEVDLMETNGGQTEAHGKGIGLALSTDGKRLFCLTNKGHLVALDIQNGNELWHKTGVPVGILGSAGNKVVIQNAGELLFFASESGLKVGPPNLRSEFE